MDHTTYKRLEDGPMGCKIKDIIIQDTNFIVYLDVLGSIQWSTNNTIEFHPQFGSIQNRVSYWESVCNKIFDKQSAYDYKCLLAEAYARIIDDRYLLLSNDILELAVKRIEKHGKEVLKQKYILSAFFCTVVSMLFILGLVLFKDLIIQSLSLNKDFYQIILTCFFGGVGAFIFTTLRLRDYSPDLAISPAIHRIDGALRIFFGLISALVIAIAIKSNIVLGFLNNIHSTTYTMALLGIVAGASEILIPNLIKQVERKTSGHREDTN